VTTTTATTATTEPARRVTACAAVAAFAACAPALAERWQVEPALSVAAIYSDNIHLLPPGASAAPGDSKEDFVGQFAPSIAIRRHSERLDVDFSYAYQYIGYAEDSDSNESFNQADAHVAAELVREHFFVDLDGGISQQLINPEQAFAPSNIPLSSNRIDTVDATLAPYWVQSIGNVGDLELRYETGIVHYENAPPVTTSPGVSFPVQDLDRQQTIVTLVNPPERRGMTWGADYEFDHQEFTTSSDVEFEEASLQFGYWVTGNARLFAVGGKESDYQEHRSDAELDESFWEVGIQYSVAARDDLEIRYGERVFGPSRYVRWEHTLTGSTLRFDYTDEASTNAEALFDTHSQPVDIESEAGLNRPETTDIFVRHRLQGTWTIDRGGRSVWDLAVYGEKRDDRIRDPDDPTPVLGTEKNFGTAADWKWKAGGRTTLAFGLGWERSDLTGSNDFDLWQASAEASYDLGVRTALRLLVEHASRDGEEFTDYDENRVSLFVDRKFFKPR
jgi:uncharacterized protein (PEP-CTERM system associated)